MTVSTASSYHHLSDVSGDDPPGTASRKLEHFVLAAFLLVTVLHAIAEASRVDVAFVLAGIKAVLYGAFVWSNLSSSSSGSLTDLQSDMLRSIPADIRAVLKTLELEPPIIRHALC
ncbi:hypothetical protein C8T65DRAFT_577487, partial [Cerioporus squamosus]